MAQQNVTALEHVTIRCARLGDTRDFYCRMIGLTDGARPDFPFRGHWLYLGAVPVFDNRDLAKAAASILGDEAMHWAILRNALGDAPVPAAFMS